MQTIRNMESKFHCDPCERTFKSAFNYNKHINSLYCKKNRNADGKIACTKCEDKFVNVQSYKRHCQLYHPEGGQSRCFVCGICQKAFETWGELKEHKSTRHLERHTSFHLTGSAHNGHTKSYRVHFPSRIKSLDQTLLYAFDRMSEIVEIISAEQPCFKINFCLNVEMFKYGPEGEVKVVDCVPFRGKGLTVRPMNSDLPLELAKICGDIEQHINDYLNQGSGWVMEEPCYLDALAVQCVDMSGSACFLHPVSFRRKKGVDVDARSMIGANDGMCFYYAVAYHFMRTVDKTKLDTFIREKLHITCRRADGMRVSDILQFEQEHQDLDMCINVVYQDEENHIIPVRAGPNIKAKNMIPLLLHHAWRDESKTETIKHFCYLDEPERLFASRYKNDDGTMFSRQKYLCWNCFNFQYRQSTHEEHVKFCHENSGQRVVLPKYGDTLCFDESQAKYEKRSSARRFKSAFILVYDFETYQADPVGGKCSCTPDVIENTKLQKQMEEKFDKNIELAAEATLDDMMQIAEDEEHYLDTGVRRKKVKVCNHKTKMNKQLKPLGYSLILLDREGNVLEERTYMAEDAAENFVLYVLHLADKYLPTLTPGKPMHHMTPEEKRLVKDQDTCYICKELMEVDERVLDHDHLTGDFLGVAHNACNLKRKEVYSLSCFSHNMAGFDSHLFIKEIALNLRVLDISAIPINTQKFKSFTLNGNIHFLDSYAFMSASLAELVSTLKASNHDFPIMRQFVDSDEELELLTRKGIYPYSFATSHEKLVKCEHLPSKEEFVNEIGDVPIDDKDYAFAKKVWHAFACNNMMEYTALYVKSDVYLLAECIVDMRNRLWNKFGLDMCAYLSLPMMALDIMLKTTNAEIELIRDQEMSDVLQKNIRGGLSFINQRYACSSEEKEHQEEGEEKSLLYLVSSI